MADIAASRKKLLLHTILVWYLRGLSILFLLGGLVYWTRIFGVALLGGQALPDMVLEWKVATVYFAVLDLVAAVGLWLGVSWGTVMWLLAALSQLAMFMVFSGIFGFDIALVVFHVTTIIGYFVLAYLNNREQHAP